MAKKTILKLVQLIGEAVSSDEIDELDETIESVHLTNILEASYEEVIKRKDWEFLKDRVLTLEDREVTDTKLYQLAIPSQVSKLQCLKYRQDDGEFKELTYLAPCDFVEMTHRRDTANGNVIQIANEDGVLLNIIDDTAPAYWTTFDEENIAFDSYDTTRGVGTFAVDSVIIATIVPIVDFTDPVATLPVPERMESLILNESISTAAVRERQTRDPKAEQLARRQHIALRELEPKTTNDQEVRTYGRRRR